MSTRMVYWFWLEQLGWLDDFSETRQMIEYISCHLCCQFSCFAVNQEKGYMAVYVEWDNEEGHLGLSRKFTSGSGSKGLWFSKAKGTRRQNQAYLVRICDTVWCKD